MSLSLYNTLTRKKEKFVPLDPANVTMYVCGPTVYSYSHIGNARPAVVFDVLVRLLRYQWPQVIFARNITDIDDKINAAAVEQKVEISVIANRFKKQYTEDMQGLGVQPPDIEPNATDHIPEMINMIDVLISAGHAYYAEGHVLFSVPSYKRYGELSRRNQEEMIAGARIEVAPYKKDPCDFILWKPSTMDLPGWDSPWGRGRPGWHLECSSMVKKHLGKTIDIHGGGIDLVFPHHENEIAQSTCANGEDEFARYWLHNGFVNINQEKMSKSTGNVLLVHDLLKDIPGEVIRLALLNTHYRQPLDWTENGIAQAKRQLDRLYGVLRKYNAVKTAITAQPDAQFLAALNEDINTPKALARLFELARFANSASHKNDHIQIKGSLIKSASFLGILQQSPESWFENSSSQDDFLSNQQIEDLVEARNRARSEKNFAEADHIRDKLATNGISLEDGPGKTYWRRNH